MWRMTGLTNEKPFAQRMVRAVLQISKPLRTLLSLTDIGVTQMSAVNTPQFSTPTPWKLRDWFRPLAAAETVMGLFKNEAVAKGAPTLSGALQTESDVVEIVFDWVRWYTFDRLHSSLGHQTPEEFERIYYDENSGLLPDAVAHKTAA